MKRNDSGWDYFDRLYCISLRKRDDRRQSAKNEFAKVGLDERVEFLIVDRLSYDLEQQIYESHMACLRKGLEAGAQNIVVFEDDIEFDHFDPARLIRCTEFLRRHPNWKVFLFGALIRSSAKTTDACVQKVRYRSLTHAYALNKAYAESLAYEPWQGIVNDTLFRPLAEDIYAMNPMCAFQKSFATDNYKYPRLALIRNLLGGLHRIQKANEFYLQHKFGIYTGQVLLILLVLIILVLF